MRCFPTARRQVQRQGGQAMVVVALMITVLLGFVALAIDSARAFDGRRVLQDAVDAGALTAADSYKAGNTWQTAQREGVTLFGTDIHNYAFAACPGFVSPSPGGAPVTTNCTLSGGVTLSVVATDLGPGGQSFTYSATQPISAALIQVLGLNPVITLAATGTALADDQAQQPAIVTLGSAGCFGTPGASLTIANSFVVVLGDIVSNGAVTVDSSSSLHIAGDVVSRCSAPGPATPSYRCWEQPAAGFFPPPQYTDPTGVCTGGGVAGSNVQGFRFADPSFAAPNTASLSSQPKPGTAVTIFPGVFLADPTFGSPVSSTCYFLSPGVYDFAAAAGVSVVGGAISNLLRPPEAIDPFWAQGGATCAGGYAVNSAATAPTLPDGTWSFYLTSTRTETIAGFNYARESVPSACQSVTTAARSIHIIISNVPGATGYNIYGRRQLCSALTPVGYLGSVNNPVSESNAATGGCPDTAAIPGPSCTLGQTTFDLLGNNVCLAVTPGPAIPADTCGALRPDDALPAFRSGLPAQNPARAAPPRGDLANYGLCAGAGAWTACPGPITPGAIELYVPSGCLRLNSGGNAFLFSGSQYNRVLLHEPFANKCSANNLTGSLNSGFVGVLYAPGASFTISSASALQTPDFGGLIVDNLTISGVNGLSVGMNPDVAAAKPAVRLSG